ncbi:MAG: hypothetical protein JXO51_12375 [Candidatus Aminicenantes bacterium]|nr:hypothetical protein [Candidatus Aminicenantes bacterium]
MRLDDYINVLLVKMKITHKPIERQQLQWLLELRTLRGHIRELEQENERLKRDYEKVLKQSEKN